MSEKTENPSNSLDMLKWLVVIGLLGGIVAGNYMYEEFSVLYRAIAAVVIVAIAGFIAASTHKGSTFIAFAKDSKTEVRKVVWPTRQETIQTTGIVLVAVFIVGLILYFLDMIIVEVVSLITGLGI